MLSFSVGSGVSAELGQLAARPRQRDTRPQDTWPRPITPLFFLFIAIIHVIGKYNEII